MSTVASRRLDALLDAAEASGSCLVAHEERDRRALRRRLGMPNSDLLSPPHPASTSGAIIGSGSAPTSAPST